MTHKNPPRLTPDSRTVLAGFFLSQSLVVPNFPPQNSRDRHFEVLGGKNPWTKHLSLLLSRKKNTKKYQQNSPTAYNTPVWKVRIKKKSSPKNTHSPAAFAILRLRTGTRGGLHLPKNVVSMSFSQGNGKVNESMQHPVPRLLYNYRCLSKEAFKFTKPPQEAANRGSRSIIQINTCTLKVPSRNEG